MGGLTTLKNFCRRALRSGRSVKARGVLLLGRPRDGQVGVSQSTRQRNRSPTLLLDLGALYGSLVGATRQTSGKL